MKKINRIAIVVDQSGSMRSLQGVVREKTNKLLSDIRARTDQDNRAVVYAFSDSVSGPFENYPEMFLNQNTALLDAVGKAIEDLSVPLQIPGNFPWDRPDIANLVIVLTDGEENCSRRYASDKTGSATIGWRWGSRGSFKSLPDLISQKQAEGNWTFAFQLPPGKADAFSRNFGMPRENCTEWEATKKGFEETAAKTQNAFAGYSVLRSQGGTQSKSFYVSPDLSKVKPKDLKLLDDMTSRFAQFRVDKESDIKAFVELRTKKPYIPGTAFFQLSKPEKVQATKQVALIEKGKKAVLGGQQARDLIGLKPFTDAKVIPGNHANFDVFVQSTSSNRKLVRGSKLLVLK